jgi:ABC-type nitrate/sulfonate/bicarbonate transport system substrate-binding protein
MHPRCIHPGFIVHLAVALFLVLSHPGCQSRRDAEAEAPRITLAYPTNISSALALIALDQGFFGRSGARIEATSFETGKAALDLLLEGKADVAVVAETPIARAILGGGELDILAAIEQSGLDVCIVARTDKGIRVPKDLRGKVVGYTQGTSGHCFLDSFLAAQGLATKDVRLVNLSPLQAREALRDGTVDAVATWDPHAAFLLGALGDRLAVFRDEFIYTQFFCVVARPGFTREHPGEVKAILHGLVAAKEVLAHFPGEATAAIAKLSKVDPGLVEHALPNHDFDVRLDQGLLISLEEESQWLMDSGALPVRPMPDFSRYRHLSGLQAVRPQGVQLIRNEGPP